MIDNTVIQLQDLINSMSDNDSAYDHETRETIAHAQSLIKDVAAIGKVYLRGMLRYNYLNCIMFF